MGANLKGRGSRKDKRVSLKIFLKEKESASKKASFRLCSCPPSPSDNASSVVNMLTLHLDGSRMLCPQVRPPCSPDFWAVCEAVTHQDRERGDWGGSLRHSESLLL